MAGVHAQMLTAGAGPAVEITDQTIGGSAVDPADASASYELRNDGTVRNHAGTLLEKWLLRGGVGDYDARVTVVSGALSSGSGAGVWLPLSTTRAWSVTQTSPGTASCQFTIEIRNASTLGIIESATIDLTATVIV